DGAVDDEAEVDGAKAHEAASNAEAQHAVEREEHRQRNGERDDEPSPKVAEKNEQHRDDEERSFEQVVAHGLENLGDEIGPAVDLGQLGSRREASPRRFQASLELMGDLAAVLTHQHESEAEHSLALALVGHRAAPEFMSFADLGDVAEMDGCAVN